MRLPEKSKSIYEYGSYVYYETGSPAFWRRHYPAVCFRKIPDVTCPVPAVGTCRNSCRTCHHPGRVVVPASGCRFRTSSSFFQRRDRKRKGGKPCLPFTLRTGQLSDIITQFPQFPCLWRSRFRQDQIHRQTADGTVHRVRIRRFHPMTSRILTIPGLHTTWSGKHGYPHEFYYVNFTDMNRTCFNPLDRRNIKDRTMLMQLMEGRTGRVDAATSNRTNGIRARLASLNGVAYRLWDEFPECCTLPHIVNFVMKADAGQLQEFLGWTISTPWWRGVPQGGRRWENTGLPCVHSQQLCGEAGHQWEHMLCADGEWLRLQSDWSWTSETFCNRNNYTTGRWYPRHRHGNEYRLALVFHGEQGPFVLSWTRWPPSRCVTWEAAFRPARVRGGVLCSPVRSQAGETVQQTGQVVHWGNFGNIFLGPYRDVEALKYTPLFFGKYEKEKSPPVPAAAVAVIPAWPSAHKGRDIWIEGLPSLEPGNLSEWETVPISKGISGRSSGCSNWRRNRCR